VKRLLNKLLDSSGITRLTDLTMDELERHLAALRQRGRAARTINMVRSVAVTFLGWATKSGRLADNPLTAVPVLDEQRDLRLRRRPLTLEEVARLLDVAEPRGRKAFYMTAALAGLRRSELGRLCWGDVDLDVGTLTVRDGKAHRVDVLPLHEQLQAELKRVKPVMVLPTARVFPTIPANLTRRKDFQRAGIPLVDEGGRVADLHSLRVTLGTSLARQGVVPQVAQRMMRHGDYRLTLKHYTVLGLEDTADALKRLPGIPTTKREAATGTVGLETSLGHPDNPQQIPQQSEHDSVLLSATRCESDPKSEPTPDSAKQPLTPSDATPCDEVRDDATERVGVPGRTRTCDRRIRNPVLYPAELRERRAPLNRLECSEGTFWI
jgi:integrase